MPKGIKKPNYDEYLKNIAIIESLKRDSIPEDTITSWWEVISRMGWSSKQLNRKFSYIMKKKSYGNDTIRIDDFFANEKIYNESEVENIVAEEVRRVINRGAAKLRFQSDKKDARDYYLDFFKIEDEEIKACIARAIEQEYQTERRVMLDEIYENARRKEKERIRDLRKTLKDLPLKRKEQLLDKLSKEGKIKISTNAEKKHFLENIQVLAFAVDEI